MIHRVKDLPHEKNGVKTNKILTAISSTSIADQLTPNDNKQHIEKFPI